MMKKNIISACMAMFVAFLLAHSVFGKNWTTIGMDNTRCFTNEEDTVLLGGARFSITLPQSAKWPVFTDDFMVVPAEDYIYVYDEFSGRKQSVISLQEIKHASDSNPKIMAKSIVSGGNTIYFTTYGGGAYSVNFETGNVNAVVISENFEENYPVFINDSVTERLVCGAAEGVMSLTADFSNGKYFPLKKSDDLLYDYYIAHETILSVNEGLEAVIGAQSNKEREPFTGGFRTGILDENMTPENWEAIWDANNIPWGGADYNPWLDDYWDTYMHYGRSNIPIMAVDDNNAYILSYFNWPYYEVKKAVFVILELRTAKVLDYNVLGGDIVSYNSLCVDDGKVFFPMRGMTPSETGIYCYSTSGSLLWFKQALLPEKTNIIKVRNASIEGNATVKEAIILSMGLSETAGGDGNVKTLYALDPDNGSVLWNSDDNGEGQVFIVSNRESIYYFSKNNKLLKYKYGKAGYSVNFSENISGSGVNSLTGNVIKSVTDIDVPGKGLSFKFVRTYNSQSDKSGILGRGWSHNYELSLLNTNEGIITLSRGDGKMVTYLKMGETNNYEGPVWENASLTDNSTYFTMTERNGLIYEFYPFEGEVTDGLLKKIKDRHNNQITFTYDSIGRIDYVTDTAGRQFDFSYTGSVLSIAGRLKYIELPSGDKIEYVVNSGYLTDVDGIGTIEAAYAYNYGLLWKYTEPRLPAGDKVKEYYYEITSGTIKRLSYVKDGKGTIIEQYSYNDEQRITTKKDAKLYEYKEYYDEQGRLFKIENPKQKTIEYTWDGFNKTRVKDEAGVVAEFEYNDYGEVVKKIAAKGTADEYTETYTYDSYGNVLTYTDGELKTTAYTYDIYGSVQTKSNAENDTITYTYYSNGLVHTVDFLGDEIPGNSYEYDSYGNLTKIYDPYSKAEEYKYDGNGGNDAKLGRLTQKIDRDGNKISYEYYTHGKVKKVTWSDPTGMNTRDNEYTYDSLLRAETIEDSRNKITTMYYYGNDLVDYVSYPDGSTVDYTYDDNENMTQMYDRNNKLTTYSYDELNRQTAVNRPEGQGTINKTYWDNHLLKTIVKPENSETITYTYDNIGRLTKLEFPSPQKIVEKKYDRAGNVMEIKDGDVTIKYYYDDAHRAEKIEYPGNKEINYTYDNRGNIATASKNWGYNAGETLTYNYDNAGRLSSVQSSIGSVPLKSYTYFDSGRRKTYTIGSDYSAEYLYDYMGRVIKVTDIDSEEFVYDYDTEGNIEKVTYPNGVVMDYVPDTDVNRTKEIKYLRSVIPQKEVVFEHLRYAYDSMNNVDYVRTLTGVRDYTYDASYRMTRVDIRKTVEGTAMEYTAYTYNNNGYRLTKNENGTTTTYSYQGERITSDGTNAYKYDDRGNLSQKGSTLYYHNEMNMLTEVRMPDDSQKVIQYGYDIENRLKTRRNQLTGDFDVYYHDGKDIVLEKDSSGNNNSIYLRGPGGVLLKEKRTYRNDSGSFTTKYYYCNDRLGSVLFITDEKGMVIENCGIDEFGNKAEGISKHGLTSNMYDKDTGLYYFHARWYDAEDGRFLEMDPVLSETTMLYMYDYCNSNPVSNTDRYGEWWSLNEIVNGVKEILGISPDTVKKPAVKDSEPEKNSTETEIAFSKNDNKTTTSYYHPNSPPKKIPGMRIDGKEVYYDKENKIIVYKETYARSKLHNPIKNDKYISFDGIHEAVFDKRTGEPETNPKYRATENRGQGPEHALDVMDWVINGTGPDDPSTVYERIAPGWCQECMY